MGAPRHLHTATDKPAFFILSILIPSQWGNLLKVLVLSSWTLSSNSRERRFHRCRQISLAQKDNLPKSGRPKFKREVKKGVKKVERDSQKTTTPIWTSGTAHR